MRVQNHTLSLLSNLSPYTSLTFTINECKNRLNIRIPQHDFGLDIMSFPFKGHVALSVLRDSSLYNYLFCGFSDYFRSTSAIWVGKQFDNPYGIKSSIERYKNKTRAGLLKITAHEI